MIFFLGDSCRKKIYSEKFDKFSPSLFRLSEDQISKLVKFIIILEDILHKNKLMLFSEAQLKD